jgi:hypothetical protein
LKIDPPEAEWMSLRSVTIKMESTPLYLLKSTEYLNLSRASWPNGFRHFRHFAILGISASSFILTLKYILPQYAQNSVLTT